MSGWQSHTGSLIHLPLDNIDTDQIIPARFMTQPRASGYGEFLFYDLRRDHTGRLDSAFPLNSQAPHSVLLAGDNFGTGSSREAAAYALVDSGFRVVIASGFGDIFAANAVNNGLLPALISPTDHTLIAAICQRTDAVTCSVDLEQCQITVEQHIITFSVDNAWRTKLINGWDDIDLTLAHTGAINEFSILRQQRYSWAWPAKT